MKNRMKKPMWRKFSLFRILTIITIQPQNFDFKNLFSTYNWKCLDIWQNILKDIVMYDPNLICKTNYANAKIKMTYISACLSNNKKFYKYLYFVWNVLCNCIFNLRTFYIILDKITNCHFKKLLAFHRNICQDVRFEICSHICLNDVWEHTNE